MRTSVRMGPRPWRPAVTLAEELRIEGKPIDLGTAARFLPLIAKDSPSEFDAWAIRWLARWLAETLTATIEEAAELAGALAELPVEPSALDAITGGRKFAHRG
jgi:hypothetical protein